MAHHVAVSDVGGAEQANTHPALGGHGHAIARRLENAVSHTDLVLCNSNAGRVAHERLGYRPPRWLVIPNGLDVDRFAPRPDERATVRSELGLEEASFVVGMCARVDPMKDHDNFVKAAAMFVETAPEARFALIGAGTNEQGSALDRAIRESGIAERFVRLGLRQDLCRLHAALDIATLSSAFGEGFPNVLAEAMACGVPCVATDVGDSASIVGDTGLIVPPHDATALAAGRGVQRARRSSCARTAAGDESKAAGHDDRVSWVVQRAGHAGKPAPRPGPVRTTSPRVRD